MKILYTACFGPLAFFVQAQDTTYVNKDQFILEETVVSGNRWEENLREVPGRISKINSQLIQFQNPQTAADLLGATNAVFIQKSQLGGGSPMIRGFATNRVLLVVDGVRMNNAIFRSGNVQNVISLDANAIESAEVIFGPGSVLYGSDAIGGVMDFHTLSVKLADEKKSLIQTNSLVRYASANSERTLHADVNVGFKRIGFLTSFSQSVFGDLQMGRNGPDEYTRPDYAVRENGADVIRTNSNRNIQRFTGYDQTNFTQKIRFNPTKQIDLIYALHYSKTSDVPRYDRLILRAGTDLSSPLANAAWYYGPQRWLMHSLAVTYNQRQKLADQIRLIAAFQDFDESRHNRSFGSNRKSHRFENVKAWSFNLDADKQISNSAELFYGAEIISNSVGSTAYREDISTGTISGLSTRYPDGSRWSSYAAYVSTKIKWHEHWITQGSLRYSYVKTQASFDTTFFDFPFAQTQVENGAVNGSVGVIYSPTQAWKFYTNISTGFRSPNVDDIGKVFDSEPGNVVVPNPDLEAEKAISAEVGIAADLPQGISFDLAGYYSVLNDAIARGRAVFNGSDSIDYDGALSRVLAQQNISKITVYGLQAQAKVNLSKHFQLTSAVNLQKGEETFPDSAETFSPTHVAPLFGSTHVLYTRNFFKLDFYANYHGAIRYKNLALTERADRHLYALDGDGNPYSPGWFTLNVKTSFKLRTHFVVDVGVENLLDKRYRPYSSGITAPGRNFFISLRAHF